MREPDPAADSEPAGGWPERLRQLALGGTAALIAGRAYWPGEDAPDGSGLAWVLALLVVLAVAVGAGIAGARLPWRFSWADLAVILLIALVGESSRHALDRRAAINVAWEWAGLGVAYLLLRHLPVNRRETGALAGALIVTAAALAVYGLFQIGVEDPEMRGLYQRDPARVLAMAGVPDEPGSRMLFEQRLLASREPRSTQALTNSLAGILVGPIVLAIGLLLGSLLGPGPSDRRQFLPVLCAGLVILLLLLVLLLTKSRTAYVGLAVGTGALLFSQRKRLPARKLALAGAGLLVTLALLVAAGLATRQLDREVLTESTKSFAYRLDYWESTWELIRSSSRSFWGGVGPGNFSTPYLRYKHFISSEEITDPHNLFLDVWASSGLPALLALVAALVLGIGAALRGGNRRWRIPAWISTQGTAKPAPLASPTPMPAPAPSPLTDPLDRRTRHVDEVRSGIYERSAVRDLQEKRARPAPPAAPTAPAAAAVSAEGVKPAAEPPIPADPEAEFAVPPALWIWWWAGVGGWVTVVLLGTLNPFAPDGLTRWFVLGWGWVAGALLLRPLVRRVPVTGAMAGAGALAVAVHLLAAGGIAMPPVALGLWGLVALGQDLRTDRPCGRTRTFADSRWWSFGMAFAVTALIGTFMGAVVPHWRSRAAMDQAQRLLEDRRPDYTAAREALIEAARLDPLTARPWLNLADLEYRAWFDSPEPPPRNTWIKIATALDRASSSPRNPDALAVQKYRLALLERLRNHPRVASDPDLTRIINEDRAEAAARAVGLYPNSPSFRAEHALAVGDLGDFKQAADLGRTALNLNAYTPHIDKKLSRPVREELQQKVEVWQRTVDTEEYQARRRQYDRSARPPRTNPPADEPR